MAYDRSLHASLREEVQALRKKVVALETAEADNEKLRKELTKLRVASLEQKSQLELDFMNQLTGVARENALRLEELEGRLAESANVNRLLSEKLQHSPSPESVERQIQEIEAQHRKDLASTIDANKIEIERTRQQLVKLMEARDQLVEQFDDAKENLAKKEKEIQMLKSQEASNDSASKRELDDIRNKLVDLQLCRDQLVKDLDNATENLVSKDAEINALKIQIKTIEETSKAKIEETLKELDSMRESREQLVTELEQAKMSLKVKESELDALNSNLANSNDENRAELAKALQHVSSLEMTRSELSQQLEETKANLLAKQTELEAIKALKLADDTSMNRQLAQAEAETNDLNAKIRNLQDELYKLSSSADSATQLLKNTLQSRDEELESKSILVRQLEAQILELSGQSSVGVEFAKSEEQEKSRLKESIQKLETEKAEQGLLVSRLQREKHDSTKRFETEVRILKEHVKSRDEELSEQRSEIQRLESQVRSLSGQLASSEQRVENLQIENAKLTANASQLETEKEQQRLRITNLEQSNEDISQKLQQRPKEQYTSPLPMNNDDVHSKKIPAFQNRNGDTVVDMNAHEKKTTQIIRQLEQNLRSEGQAKQAMTAILKSKAASDIDEKQISAMKEEIAMLKMKLETERNQTTTLRLEISELKPNDVSRSFYRQSSLPNPGTPVRAKPKNMYNKSTNDSFSRTPVRGLVQTFEKKLTNHAKRTGDDFSSFGGDNVEELKDALHFEKQQVLELEEELTRQCEINCALLKEIASLSQDTESSRSRHASVFHGGTTQEKKRLETLSTEISQLKIELESARKEKALLVNQFEQSSESSKRNIENLNSELNLLQTKLAKAEGKSSSMSHFEIASASDKLEIDRLRMQIRQVESQLSQSQMEVQQLEREKAVATSEIERLQTKISSLEDERQAKRRMAEDQEIRMSQLEMEVERLKLEEERASQLETELGRLEVMKSDYTSRGDEIAGLKSLIEGLQASLGDAHVTEVSLQAEKETTLKLELLVDQLKKDLKTAEDKISGLTSDFQNIKDSEQETISRLTVQVESLTQELKQVSDHRDNLELNCRVHHLEKIESLNSQLDSIAGQLQVVTEERDQVQEQNRVHNAKFDALRCEIDGKVDEFEKIHRADKEEICQLHNQVQSLEKDLQTSLATIDELKTTLQDRERVEATVENLQRENQLSFDTQINKLQKELTNTRLSEAETKKKIESLEKSIASMQEESSKSLAIKDSAIEELRKTLGDKEGAIDRLMKEKEQLVLSMKDMTVSRRDEIDELQSELMEMSTRAANQAREVQTLKVQLEDSEYRKEEMDRLRKKVRELSQQIATKSPAVVDDEKTSELQMENTELRQRLRDANLAIKAAEGKMRELAAEKGSSKSMQVLRDRNASLKFEVEKLTRKLQKLAERKQIPDSQRSNNVNRQDRSNGKDRNSYGSEGGDSVQATTRFMI